jgi:hypothetical protein
LLIAWAVSCDSYELHEDGTADIYGAGFDTFRVDRLPIALELIILVRLLLQEDERGKIDLHLLAPETTPLGTLTFDVEPEPGPNHRPGYTVNQTEAFKVQFDAETTGVYSAELYIVGRRQGDVSEDRRRSLFFSVRDDLDE